MAAVMKMQARLPAALHYSRERRSNILPRKPPVSKPSSALGGTWYSL
jgi:hypothetical protein